MMRYEMLRSFGRIVIGGGWVSQSEGKLYKIDLLVVVYLYKRTRDFTCD